MMKEKDQPSLILDEEGLNRLKAELEVLKTELAILNEREIPQDDHREAQLLNGARKLVIEKIYDLEIKIKNAVIAEVSADPNTIELGDVVVLKAMNADGTTYTDEYEVYKLVSGTVDFEADITEVGIESPLGAAVYQQKVGEFIT